MTGEARRIAAEFEKYFQERGRFRLDPEGRSAKHTHWRDEGEGRGTEGLAVAQMLVDLEEQNDWEARFIVSLERSRVENRVVLEFRGVNAVGVGR
jgi:hypothetical protein